MNKPRILIVDDVSSNIHLLMNILKEDYTLIAATSGQKAIQLAKTHPLPDMILLDVVMPDIDGYEVCKQLKENSLTSHIPIVFVTSLNSIEQQEEALKIGAIDFITKPFSKEIILHKIRTYISIEKTKQIDEERLMLKVLTQRDLEELKPSLLVVDDSPENIQVMIEVLKNDYTVSVATSGLKALEMLEEGLKPDLILLDVIMPEMNGYEFCEILNDKKEYSNIPIIFVTILEHEKDIVRGFELGAVDYVIKPIEPVVLKARINTHLKLKIYNDKLVEDLKTKEELILNQSKLAILGEMFENITHQWKQPLSSITVATSGIKIQREYDQLDDEKLLHGLETIETSVKYLSHTVDDFRNFLAYDTQKHRFDLNTLVDRTVNLLSAKLKGDFIEIQKDIGDISTINYENDLMQVLMNLINNAHDALLDVVENRKIKIAVEVFDTQLIIKVIDNAGGIKDENIAFIFDKYFTTKAHKEGSGVGLFMSKKIVEERLHGTITVQNIDEGACFEVTLPKE